MALDNQLEMQYQTFFENAVRASRLLSKLNNEQINSILKSLATRLITDTALILAANAEDLKKMPESDPKYDRLKLTADRINSMANEVSNVITLKSPLADIISSNVLPNGLEISKIRVPLGVIGVIYEARPNVTLDVFTLCFKTGNVAILKGGSDADASNKAIIQVIHETLSEHGVDLDVAILLPVEREATAALLNAKGYVDVLIPRGSQALIDYVRQNSKVPVIETGAGIVHTYFDVSGDADKGRAIVFNAKTRRVSVCNALDCFLIHRNRLSDLNYIIEPLAEREVEIYADEESYAILVSAYPAHLLHKAKTSDYGTEFLDYKLSIKTVADLDEALIHIASYSSKHSEAIIAEDEESILTFLNTVDAAAVYANASTAFTDGGQFGLGAEIGISTQKLHARGPMGLEELTSYKWVIRGSGQVR